MARNCATTTNPKVPEAPRSETDAAKVGDNDRQASDVLAATQTALTLKAPGFSEEDSSALKNASVARYREFAPVDATEKILASLSVGMQNAAMTALQYSAEANCFDVRNQEFKIADRAGKTVIDALRELDRHRGRNNQDVQVGQVTVETGGQAFVGNVNSDGKADETDDPSGAEE
jgi:hypothetical protein